MREHQIVITLKPEQFLEVQRLSRAAGAKSMGMFVRQRLLAALGLEGGEPVKEKAAGGPDVKKVSGELRRLHGELKAFVAESLMTGLILPEPAVESDPEGPAEDSFEIAAEPVEEAAPAAYDEPESEPVSETPRSASVKITDALGFPALPASSTFGLTSPISSYFPQRPLDQTSDPLEQYARRAFAISPRLGPIDFPGDPASPPVGESTPAPPAEPLAASQLGQEEEPEAVGPTLAAREPDPEPEPASRDFGRPPVSSTAVTEEIVPPVMPSSFQSQSAWMWGGLSVADKSPPADDWSASHLAAPAPEPAAPASSPQHTAPASEPASPPQDTFGYGFAGIGRGQEGAWGSYPGSAAFDIPAAPVPSDSAPQPAPPANTTSMHRWGVYEDQAESGQSEPPTRNAGEFDLPVIPGMASFPAPLADFKASAGPNFIDYKDQSYAASPAATGSNQFAQTPAGDPLDELLAPDEPGQAQTAPAARAGTDDDGDDEVIDVPLSLKKKPRGAGKPAAEPSPKPAPQPQPWSGPQTPPFSGGPPPRKRK